MYDCVSLFPLPSPSSSVYVFFKALLHENGSMSFIRAERRHAHLFDSQLHILRVRAGAAGHGAPRKTQKLAKIVLKLKQVNGTGRVLV